MINDADVTPQDRLTLLKEVAEDASAFKLGGEDKIRVATGTCETIVQHTAQLDLITSLITSLMPPHLLEQMPASTAPSGYPKLFPAYATATYGASTYSNTQYLTQRSHKDWFPPAQHHSAFPTGVLQTGSSRHAKEVHGQAVHQVERARGEGPLPPVKPVRKASEKDKLPRKISAVAAPRKLPFDQQAYFDANLPLPPPPLHPIPRKPSIATAVDEHTRSEAGGKPHSTPLLPTEPVHADDDVHMAAAQALTTEAMGAKKPAGNGNGKPKSTQRPTRSPSPADWEGTDEYLPTEAAKRKRAAARKTEASPDPGASISPVTTTARAASKAVAKRKASSQAPGDEAAPHSPASANGKSNRVSTGSSAALPAAGAANNSGQKTDGESGDAELYCYCNTPSYGEMIACDNGSCSREWFHLACTGLNSVPTGSWYCDECRAMLQPKRKRREVT